MIFVIKNAQWIADTIRPKEAVSSLKPHSVQWVIERTNELARVIGIKPSQVSVKRFGGGRWGDCNWANEIRYEDC